jgi:hypothetical protein
MLIINNINAKTNHSLNNYSYFYIDLYNVASSNFDYYGASIYKKTNIIHEVFLLAGDSYPNREQYLAKLKAKNKK